MTARQFYHTLFDNGVGPAVQDDGTVASGADGETNKIIIGDIPWEFTVEGTQTVLVPAAHASGLDITMTDTNGQGKSIAPYGHVGKSPLEFTIGGPAFYCQWTMQATDWSGTTCLVGFHGGAAAQAGQDAFADYTDKATMGNYAGGAVTIYQSTALNNAGDTDTDTTVTLTDGDVMRVKVLVSAAGVVTFTLEKAATASPTTFVTAAPTTAAFTFDDTDVVRPFLHAVAHTETATLLLLKHFECGLQ